MGDIMGTFYIRTLQRVLHMKASSHATKSQNRCTRGVAACNHPGNRTTEDIPFRSNRIGPIHPPESIAVRFGERPYGISKGKRPDLTGGGLLRSIGGWTGLKDFRKAGIRVKGDERILGDSDFVETVLASANEALEERYFLKARGIDFDRVVSRVAEVMKLTPDQVTAWGKSPQTVQARSLLCYWAHRKLGMTTIEIAKRLKISQPAASRSSKRGEQVEKEHRFELIDSESMKA
jgi:hypothetical protein